jgi:probable rRNA maturation factor
VSGAIAIQRRVSPRGIPAPRRLRAWARAALGRGHGDLTIRIVGATESRTLNRTYRGKDKPTNVLSFAGSGHPERSEGSGQLPRSAGNEVGDLVICSPVVAREAREQNKSVAAHWAHMVIHGCLHLQGYDHEQDRQARVMEARETGLMKDLGFPDPYR